VALLLNLASARDLSGLGPGGGQAGCPVSKSGLYARCAERCEGIRGGQDLNVSRPGLFVAQGHGCSLDPHSEFMDGMITSSLQSAHRRDNSGSGPVVSMRDNFVTVIAPMETPGMFGGILTATAFQG